MQLRPAPGDDGGRSGADLDVSLPRLPASDWQRVRDGGAVAEGSGRRRRTVRGIRRISDAEEERTFRFCPDCGATVFWTTEGWTGSIAVAIGAFADPSFPQPTVSVYGSRRYPWLSLPDGIEEEHH
jgi:hypothetical protein